MASPKAPGISLKPVRWNELSEAARVELLRRPNPGHGSSVAVSVRETIEQVLRGGDPAVRALTEQLDGVRLEALEAGPAEFEEAERAVAGDVKRALSEARDRLIAWHRAGMASDFRMDTAPGVSCGRILRGIQRVGLYVPSGSAPLPSTALMLGVPAALAGCEEILLCTPPRKDGRADPTVLVAARLSGIHRVFKIGGAQAIAAMALGTATVPACHKLFGPGNAYVTGAKQQVAALPGGPAIDMPAGPSEVLVIADRGASPAFVAADLLAQAEHGPDSQVILLATDEDLIEPVLTQIASQLEALPRAATARRALEHARVILVEDTDAALAVSNLYAPEHLILALREPERFLPKVRAAGSVFLGDHAPETLGDYCSGTNHVLPTNGAARGYSGVSVSSFQNSISVQSVSPEGLAAIGPCAVTLARAEGLEAHAQAVIRRLSPRP